MKKSKIPLAKSPDAWRITAIGLKRSADIIWEQWFGIFSRLEGGKIFKASNQEAGDLRLLIPSFLLLYGLALENAFKGLIIAKDPSITEYEVKWKIKGGGHDLSELHKESGLSITKDEQKLLDDLTQAVLWAGRYPVPKKHANKSEFFIPLALGSSSKPFNVKTLVSRFANLKKTCDRLYLLALSKYPKNN
jgi:hypothetical protein